MMNKNERFITLTERLYVGFVKYTTFFEEEIERLEGELEKKQNGLIRNEGISKELLLYDTNDKVNNNLNFVDKEFKEGVQETEYLTNNINKSDEKINYDIKKELQINNSTNKKQIIINEYKTSCESLDKLRLENELELQKENYKIYNIYSEKILTLYYQLKGNYEESSMIVSTTSSLKSLPSNGEQNEVFNDGDNILSDPSFQDSIIKENKKEIPVENTKLYKKSKDSLISRSDSITSTRQSLSNYTLSTTTSLKKQLLASNCVRRTSLINTNQVITSPQGPSNNSKENNIIISNRQFSQTLTSTVGEHSHISKNNIKPLQEEEVCINKNKLTRRFSSKTNINISDTFNNKTITEDCNHSFITPSSSFLTTVTNFIFNSNSLSKSSQLNNKSSLCIELEISNMMGRLQLEIKGIIGFARLTTGDTFEVSFKHGNQKIKSRGKTLPDKTQIWDTTTIMLECLPTHPIEVKVQEVKFFKSKTLSERNFDPSSFFTTTSQLVTMNLNSSGTIKLQFIITWIPLLASKTISNQSTLPTTNLVRSATQLTSMPYSPTITVKNSTSFCVSHPVTRAKSSLGNDNEKNRPRIVLRDKKRNKNKGESNIQKDQWRASTTLLDAAYNNLSKSIPTLDSLSALKELSRSKNNIDNENIFELEDEIPTIEENQRSSKFFSVSMNQLSVPDDTTISRNNGTPSPKAISDNGNVDERHSTEQTIQFNNKDINESFFTSTTSNSSGIGSDVSNNSEQGLKIIDELLGIIDVLRENISILRKNEIVEINAFEAGMLSWESVLKFNRANIIEDRKFGKIAKNRDINSGYSNNKKGNMYTSVNNKESNNHSMIQYDDLDDNVLVESFNNSSISKLSGNIGLNKNTSQYTINRSYCGGNNYSPVISERQYNNSTLSGSCGPSQRRFKQFRDRRKSLGIVFDQMSMSDISNNGIVRPWNNGGDVMSVSEYSFDLYKSATSNSQLDDCLKHHLINALNIVKTLTQIVNRTPFEYKISQLLGNLDNSTLALEEMMLINDNLPNIPNVSNMLSELGVECDIQELWLGICYSLSSFLIIPTKELTIKLYEYVSPIVSVRYPDLVNQVISRFMKVMCDEMYWNTSSVSLYQFISTLRGKKIKTYFENLAHEGWISKKLSSDDCNEIAEIMYRLKNIPMVPPIESLRSIALVLLSEKEESIQPVCLYLVNSNAELAEDLTTCFLALLEDDDEKTRIASCRVLSILKPRNVLKQLEYVMNYDTSEVVRRNAKHALTCIGFNITNESVQC
ncbi:Armadillo-like helical domain and Armadillo-type fold domain-containing protein [Strongyloides ratti]|uniref:Armadillo-like helical domain and Armadillo-type fold domain-containing protein n=1 Tax=Strongyloides ratti TaxID=34506 RepID=A0A090LUE1_STRRB|nr:Armadillo-like helical domain and Armadillo-type fold domain-containing protein [Strongyloides ratti]CEF71214.1 Armadillo-like helical domain and Armadillo-type fold domain-containing protein [Strongyloides ratti]